jgi:hypothetical protein
MVHSTAQQQQYCRQCSRSCCRVRPGPDWCKDYHSVFNLQKPAFDLPKVARELQNAGLDLLGAGRDLQKASIKLLFSS